MAKKKVSDEAQQKRSLLIDYRATFRSEDGERVLKDLMANHHVFTGTFDKDPMVMAFREGERSVIMAILDKLRVDPEKFAKMYDDQYGDGP